ncbi:MAG: PTS glucose transporter subunit IIA [Erysipelotrichaceae bacterium]|nr:PTS glucose transporter subunit IIA [Erysipelotrichaceae bacterium]
MGLLDIFKKEKLKEYDDNQIVSVCDGEIIDNVKIEDEMFANEMLGKTIAFIPEKKEIVSPCNGTLEVVFPTGHAFAVRTKDGTGILVHIGINTVDLNGRGFKVFCKQGEKVKAGQKIVEVDLNLVKESGYPVTTMLIVTEPVENKSYEFNKTGKVEKAEPINA